METHPCQTCGQPTLGIASVCLYCGAPQPPLGVNAQPSANQQVSDATGDRPSEPQPTESDRLKAAVAALKSEPLPPIERPVGAVELMRQDLMRTETRLYEELEEAKAFKAGRMPAGCGMYFAFSLVCIWLGGMANCGSTAGSAVLAVGGALVMVVWIVHQLTRERSRLEEMSAPQLDAHIARLQQNLSAIQQERGSLPPG